MRLDAVSGQGEIAAVNRESVWYWKNREIRLARHSERDATIAIVHRHRIEAGQRRKTQETPTIAVLQGEREQREEDDWQTC